MVLFPDYDPLILNAYSTVPLTRNITAAVQRAVWDGTYARFGNPTVAVTIHDRPKFHNRSHYEIRTQLDSENMLSNFIIVNNGAITDGAAWLVESTEMCKYDSESAIESGQPAVTYPGENFTIWQVYLHTSDIPVQWASWDVGCGDMMEWLLSLPGPYDPHRPQLPPSTLGVNWTDPSNAGFWGGGSVQANYSEIEVSTKDEDRANMQPKPPLVIRLNLGVARESGLLQSWYPAYAFPKANDTIHLGVSYDWDSPKWPKDYPGPDNALNIGSQKSLSSSKQRILKGLTASGKCRSRSSQLLSNGLSQVGTSSQMGHHDVF